MAVKNYTGTVLTGNVGSAKEFLEEFADVNPDATGGYTTHFNNQGPINQAAVEKTSNQGLAKFVIAAINVLSDRVVSEGAGKNDATEAGELLKMISEFVKDSTATAQENRVGRITQELNKLGLKASDVLEQIKSKKK